MEHRPSPVIPAQAGIQTGERPRVQPHPHRLWIPASAGMTERVPMPPPTPADGSDEHAPTPPVILTKVRTQSQAAPPPRR